MQTEESDGETKTGKENEASGYKTISHNPTDRHVALVGPRKSKAAALDQDNEPNKTAIISQELTLVKKGDDKKAAGGTVQHFSNTVVHHHNNVTHVHHHHHHIHHHHHSLPDGKAIAAGTGNNNPAAIEASGNTSGGANDSVMLRSG